MATAALNGLPSGKYGCRVDGTGEFESNLDITTSATYTGGYEAGTVEAPLSYDPSTRKVSFMSGDYFTAPGYTPSHHFVGEYPSSFPGDTAGTILLSQLKGYPDDSDVAPAIEGSTSGLWHCTPSSESGSSTATTLSTPDTTAAAAGGNALAVPYGVYVANGYNNGAVTYEGTLRVRSDGTYSLGADPNSTQTGAYQVTSSSEIAFTSGPYAGSTAGLFPHYKGSNRTYIDVTYQGTTTDYEYSTP